MNYNKKISGFTTLELSIVLLMSGIIASMAYSGYNLLTKQYYSNGEMGKEQIKQQTFLYLLKKDITTSKTITHTHTIVYCLQSMDTIQYDFGHNEFILRTTRHTCDTFALLHTDPAFTLKGMPSQALIDKISLDVTTMEQTYPLELTKQYDSKSLIEYSSLGH